MADSFDYLGNLSLLDRDLVAFFCSTNCDDRKRVLGSTEDKGQAAVTATGELSRPRWIINFPTKHHWRHPSRMEWLEEGLKDLVSVVREKGIRSIGLPQLGCGNRGLDWRDVKTQIDAAADELPEVTVIDDPFSDTCAPAMPSGGGVVAFKASIRRRQWNTGMEARRGSDYTPQP